MACQPVEVSETVSDENSIAIPICISPGYVIKPRDYSKSVIYAIKSKDPTIPQVYIGSTIDILSRKWSHVDAYLSGDHTPLYEFIREHGGGSMWEIEIIEEWPCETRDELLVRELFHMVNLSHPLNAARPMSSKKLRTLTNLNDYDRAMADELIAKDEAAEKARMFTCSECGAKYKPRTKLVHNTTATHIQVKRADHREHFNIGENYCRFNDHRCVWAKRALC